MNKKLMAATVMAAMIMSVSSAFAAGLALPGVGSKLDKDGNAETEKAKDKNKNVVVHVGTKTEYKLDNANAAKVKHEGKLYVDGKVDDMWTAEVGLNIETKTDNSKQSEAEKWEMENVWLKYQTTPDFAVTFGRQTYHLAKGLYIDQDGVMGGKAVYKIDKRNTVEVFSGRDTQDWEDEVGLDKKGNIKYTKGSQIRMLQVLNWANTFKAGSFGAYWAKQTTQDNSENRYWGAYGNYAVAPKLDFNFEYLKNTYLSKNGYIAELRYGQAKKPGQCSVGIDYMNVDANIYETNNYTDFDSQIDPAYGFKGPGLIVDTLLSKNSKLKVQKWWGTQKTGAASVPVTKVTLEIKF